jgi:hypothetical protein
MDRRPRRWRTPLGLEVRLIACPGASFHPHKEHPMIRSVCTLLVCMCLAAIAAAQEKKEPKNYATPQDVFTAATDALKKKDVKAAMTCFTGESRDAVAGTMIFMGQLIASFAEFDPKTKDKAKELKAIMDKYGLTKDAMDKLKLDHLPKGGPANDPEKMKAAMAELGKLIKKDRNGFIADMIKFLDKEQPGGGKGLIGDGAKLEDLAVDGNHAKATVVSEKDGKPKRDPIEFKKTPAAGWRIDLPAKEFKLEFGGPPKN